MIQRKAKRYCNGNLNLVEGYEMASKDDKKWACHHRLETHDSDGNRRIVDITSDELKALGMYYHRPSEELIFMPFGEHMRLHIEHRNFNHGEEWKEKVRIAKTGIKQSPEHIAKRIAHQIGKKHSEEWKKHQSEKVKEYCRLHPGCYNNNMKKRKVLCIELNIEFESVKEASRYINRVDSGIITAIKKGNKSGGYHWKYI